MARYGSSHVVDRRTGVFFFPRVVLVSCVFTCLQVTPVQGQTLPTFELCDTLEVPENTEIGTTLFSVTARVNDDTLTNTALTFTMTEATEELVNLTQPIFENSTDGKGQWTCDVILATILDRDYEPNVRSLSFSAIDANNQKGDRICKILILDWNDNAPSFQGLPYHIAVDERTNVSTVLMSGISASDPDQMLGGQVILFAQFADPSVKAMFNTSITQQDSSYVMDIMLAHPLNYENRTFYTFSLLAVDGLGLNSTADVRVTVTDVQDTPPVFLLESYRAAILEHQPEGTPVITVSAVDGDHGPANDIIYSIVQGQTDYFNIDSATGSITSSVELDRDDPAMMDTDGVFKLTVRATETEDVQPQWGVTTAEVEVVVVVEDVNDHPPTFDQGQGHPSYKATVREDAPQGSLIYFQGNGYISVSDADQGRNSHFNLTVERGGVPWPVLQATPSQVFLEALVLLRVTQKDALVEFAGTDISLQLVAQEVSTAERLSSTAEIVITVEPLPEPTTPPPLTLEEKITAPDIVVFIIGFLVVFNVVATGCIIWYVRRSTRNDRSSSSSSDSREDGGEENLPRQGLARRGSKYYVNGVEKESRKSTELPPSGSVGAVSLRSESVLLDVDGKDRCDVVPLGEGEDNDEGGRHSTDRRVLISSEVEPAKSSLVSINTGSATSLQDRTHGGGAGAGGGGGGGMSGVGPQSSSSASSRITSASAAKRDDRLPNFSKAKRNVSSPKSPAFSLSVPDLKSASSSSSNTSTVPTAAATTSPTTATTTTTTTAAVVSPAPKSSPVASSSHSRNATTAVTRTPPIPTVATTPSTSAESMVLEPVTRFSAQGAVSTTAVAAVAVGQPAGAPASTVPSKHHQHRTTPPVSSSTTAAAPRENGSMTEILY